MTSCLPIIALKREDLPTLGLPTMDTFTACLGGRVVNFGFIFLVFSMVISKRSPMPLPLTLETAIGLPRPRAFQALFSAQDRFLGLSALFKTKIEGFLDFLIILAIFLSRSVKIVPF